MSGSGSGFLMKFQSSCHPGPQSLEDLPVAGGITSKFTQEALGRRLHFFSIGPLNKMAAGFPQVTDGERDTKMTYVI